MNPTEHLLKIRCASTNEGEKSFAIVATLKKIDGEAWLHRAPDQMILLTTETKIRASDEITTQNRSVKLEFSTGDIMVLGRHSKIKIPELNSDLTHLEETKSVRSQFLKLLRGSVEVLSGELSKPGLDTPTFAIGIRGTRFLVDLEGPPKCPQKVRVYSGNVVVTSLRKRGIDDSSSKSLKAGQTICIHSRQLSPLKL